MFTGMRLSTLETNSESSDDRKSSQLADKNREKENSHDKKSGFSFINDSFSERSPNDNDTSDTSDKRDGGLEEEVTKTLKDDYLDPFYSNPGATKTGNIFSLDLDGLEFTVSEDNGAEHQHPPETTTSSFNFIKHVQDDVEEESLIDKEHLCDAIQKEEAVDDEDDESTMEGDHIGLTERVERLKLISKSKLKKEKNIHKNMDEIIKASLSSVVQLVDKQTLLQDLELSEKQALDDENYEKAEELNIRLEQIKIEMKNQSVIQPHTHVNYGWLLSNLDELTNEELLQQEHNVELAKKLKVEVEEKREEIADKKRHCEQDTELEIQKRRQKLATAKGHLKLDKEDLTKCEKLLENRIGEETKEFESKKCILEVQQQCVQEEIDELLKKLASLRKQEEEIKESIEEQNDLIGKAREGFAEEIHQLECDEEEIKQRENELQVMEDNLKFDEEDLKNKTQSYDEEESQYESLLPVIQDVIQSNKSNVEVLKQSSGQIVPDLTPTTLEINPPQCITRLQETASEGVEKIKRATSVMIAMQTEVTLQAKTLSSLQGQIEELRVAKQVAVQGKQFSEAKKLSMELKTMSEEVEAVKNQLEGSRESLDKLKKELLEMRKDQEELETQLKDKEMEQDTKQLESAHEVFNKIKLISHDRHQPMIERILQAEIQTCSLWMKYLCSRLNVALDDDVAAYLEQHPVSQDILKGEQQKESQEARKLIDSLEKSLESAIEEENYDAAESIQLEIDTLKSVL
ncbi:spindle pole body component 110-like isoform X2 [Anneissia japonica]|nr:spindle pole body component 110-like isoform X2 [Anneissia japonica]XP_033110894.1 spindle pole body component 110-like isoform X2 [Anneissia japonica]XP_033110895.1 spindle pole body component 110-like isoform X2 [Anneissia japonica]XP_033110896.1 spindle pole body component 110-like isoform X2 [Anneissia japonica]XP_033110897.1 spindle pole body component 110-like isoform X2 [Anneissia japonica]